MNTNRRNPRPALRTPSLLVGLALAGSASAAPFVYQGSLSDGGQPANGRYDLQLQLYRSENGFDPIGATITVPGVDVRAGVFRVEADVAAPAGAERAYVSVGVRESGIGAKAFATLPGREPVALATAAIGACWSSTGDAGSDPATNFIGTTDNQPFVIRVNNQRIASFAQATDATNILMGWYGNTIGTSTRASVISGGGGAGTFVTSPNKIGNGNEYATIAGGRANQIADGAYAATIGGGDTNKVSGNGNVVAGGRENQAAGMTSTIAGGAFNRTFGSYATVPGGASNVAGGTASFAAGFGAVVRAPTGTPSVSTSADGDGDEGTFVWADNSAEGVFVSTGPNQFLVRAAGGVGINTTTMGAAATLNGGELIVKNGGDNNTDLVMMGGNNRGFRMTSVPNGSNQSIFQLAELDARTGSPSNNPVLQISAAGDTLVKGGAVGTLSDRRLKKNIEAIEGPLDRMLALRGHMFEYLDPSASMSEPGPRMGFVAQEVAEVLPGWVHEAGDGYYLVKPIGFEALTVEALRELQARSEAAAQAAEARIEALARDNAELRAMVERLVARDASAR